MMPWWILFLLGGYVYGSILWPAILLKAVAKKDIYQESQDHNPGVYNVFSLGGIPLGSFALFLELQKGFLPVFLAAHVLPVESPWFALCMLAPVAGHICPLFSPTKGGKGIAAAFGVLLGILPHWIPLVLLAVIYLLFSLLLKIPSHRVRSAISFFCFALVIPFLEPAPGLCLGGILLGLLVGLRHWFAGRKEEKEFSLERESK